MQEYRTSRVTELNFNVVTWKRDTKNRKVFMPMRHVFDPGFVVGQSDEKGRDESSWDGNRISPLDPSTNPPRPIMSGKIEEKCRKDTRHRYSFLWTSLDPSENARYSFRLVNIRSEPSTSYFVIPIFEIFILWWKVFWALVRDRNFVIYFSRCIISNFAI